MGVDGISGSEGKEFPFTFHKNKFESFSLTR